MRVRGIKRYDEDYEYTDREFVAVSRTRTWRNLLLGTVMVMLVVASALGILFITSGSERVEAVLKAEKLGSSGTGISLSEVLNGTFSPNSFNGTWISDTEFQYRTETGAVNLYDVKTLKSKEVISASLMTIWRPFKFELSPSRKYILFVHEIQKLFRYSYLARHTIINLETEQATPLAPQRVRSRTDQPPLLYAEWAPNNDALAFVFHNDLYYATSPDLDTMYRVTDTGQIGTIFNGIPDWVYEEEIINSNSALWFSPDGARLAFATFNDTDVDTMNFPLYGRPGDPTFQYPLQQSIKYPKPGRSNPVVDLWVVDINRLVSGSSDTVTRLPPPVSLASRDHYFTAVSWANSQTLSVIWMNRHQNESVVSLCSLNGKCKDDLVHVSPDNAWNDLFTAPKFDSKGDAYLLILPTNQGAAGTFKHINFRNIKTQKLEPLTTGTYEVIDILSWDKKNHLIYFSGAPAGKPGQRHMYYVGDPQSEISKQAFCVTCDFMNDYSEDCFYNSVDMSKGASYYVLSCNGPGIPQVTIHKASDHVRLAHLEENHEIRQILHNRKLPLEKRLEMDIEGGFKAQVSMKLPPNYNHSELQKYPMLVYVYGGPGSQLVNDRFRIDWGDYLASEKGIIYVSIDGRGSGFEGDRKLHALYRGLGTAEVDDQISVSKALLKSFPSIDPQRTAIWGWSYGGYVTASVMAKDTEDVLKCGIAVAPVTSWLYYDTAYTERFMGLPTPEDNLAAYTNSDVTNQVENFRKKDFFLIHGTADDNVHYQQSMMLSRALQLEDILFTSQSYPDENHGLAGVKQHHYHSMEAFLNQCFNFV